jgi:lysophospholipase L1-like esterase
MRPTPQRRRLHAHLLAALLVAGGLLGGRLDAAAIAVACVGDSITAGAGASDGAHAYPALLANLLGSGYVVGNFGHSGATLLRNGDLPYWMVGEFAASDAFAPDIVVIMLGTNDSKPQNWTSFNGQFVGDYGDLIDHYRALPSRPLVFCCRVCPVYGSGNFGITSQVVQSGVIPLIDQVAAAKGAPEIDVNAALSGLPGDFPDNVHPDDAGYALLAQTVYGPIHPPAAIGSLGAQAVSATRIDLAWTDAADNETGFTIARGAAPGGPFTVIAIAAANATAFSDTGLVAATQYFYQVSATNAAGGSTAGAAQATTPAAVPGGPGGPGAPAAVAGSSRGCGSGGVSAALFLFALLGLRRNRQEQTH